MNLQNWQWLDFGNLWCAWAVGYDVSINFNMVWHAWNWWTHVLVWILIVVCFPNVTQFRKDQSNKQIVEWDMFFRSRSVVKPPHAQWLRQKQLEAPHPQWLRQKQLEVQRLLLKEGMQSCRPPWPRRRSCPILCRQEIHHLLCLRGLLLTGPVCWLWLWSASTCNKCCLDSFFLWLQGVTFSCLVIASKAQGCQDEGGRGSCQKFGWSQLYKFCGLLGVYCLSKSTWP